MVLKIRFARFGKRHAPVYNIVLTQARTARGSKPIEVLGTYDPTPRVPLATGIPLMGGSNFDQSSSSSSSSPEVPSPEDVEQLKPYQQKMQRKYKRIELDSARIKYWLGVGAQPTDSVGRFFGMVGLLEPFKKQRPSPVKPTTQL